MKECHLEIEYTTFEGKRLKPVLAHSYISKLKKNILISYMQLQDPKNVVYLRK